MFSIGRQHRSHLFWCQGGVTYRMQYVITEHSRYSRLVFQTRGRIVIMNRRTCLLFTLTLTGCCGAALGSTVTRNFGPFANGASVAGVVAGNDGTHVVLADSTSGPVLLRVGADNSVVRAVQVGLFHATSLAKIPSGFLLTGTGRADTPWVMKVNDRFEVEWNETLDGDFRPQAVGGANDGSIYLGGYRSLPQIAALMKLAADGSILWRHTFHGSGHADQIVALQPTNDGVVAAGSTECGASLWKVRSNGTFVWQRCFSFGRVARFMAVTSVDEDGIVAVGHDDASMIVVRTDGAGLFRWKTSVTSARLADATDVVVSRQQIVVVGTAETTSNAANLVVIAFTFDGKPVWQRSYGSPAEASAIASSTPFSHRNASADGDGGVVVGVGIEESMRLLRFPRDGSSSDNCTAAADTTLKFFPSPPVGESIAVETHPFDAAAHRIQAATAAANVSSTQAICSAPPTTAVSSVSKPQVDQKQSRAAVYQQTSDLLIARKFAELDTLADEWRRTRARIEPLSPKLLILYDAVAGQTVGAQVGEEAQEKLLKEWIASRPSSPTAVLALGRYYVTLAGAKRGSGFTVSDKGSEEFQRYIDAALKLLKEHQQLAAVDPQYDATDISATGDGSQYFQLAAAAQADVDVIGAAAIFLLPQWGGTPEQYERLMDIAVARTKDDIGETMYTRLALRLTQLACCGKPEELWETYHLDWARIQKGAFDWAAQSPSSAPLHRLAILAYKRQDRAVLAGLFSRPDMKWDEIAQSEWQSQSGYDAARKWAFPKMSRLGSPIATKWPDVLLDADVTLKTGEHRRVWAFLAQGPDGVVAVSSLEPFRSPDSYISTFAQAREKIAAWKLTRPGQTEQAVPVSGNITPPTSWARAIVLAVSPGKDEPALQPLEIADTLPEMQHKVFVLACSRSEATCNQRAFEAKVMGAGGGGTGTPPSIFIFVDGISGDDLIGAPVVDEGGFAVCVAVGNGSIDSGKQTIQCEGLSSLIRGR